MIVARVCGGLGNQLFQYASARAFADRCDEPLLLDLSWYEEIPELATDRNYELYRYPIRAEICSKDQSLLLTHQNRSYIYRLLPCLRRLRLYKERSLGFDFNMLNLEGNAYLEGYWQSPKYFQDNAVSLRNEFIPHLPQSVADLSVKKSMSTVTAISVHVRRGDYVAKKGASDFHGVCTMEYYKSSIALLTEMVENPKFYFFSDDPLWVSDSFDFCPNKVVVDHNDGDSAFQDLRLLSNCEHHIISNSTFSWWGAWLSDSQKKRVFAS